MRQAGRVPKSYSSVPRGIREKSVCRRQEQAAVTKEPAENNNYNRREWRVEKERTRPEVYHEKQKFQTERRENKEKIIKESVLTSIVLV